MTAKPTSVRLEEELIARLDKLGEACQRSRGWLISEAVRRYLEEGEDFVAKIEEAREDIRQGRGISTRR